MLFTGPYCEIQFSHILKAEAKRHERLAYRVPMSVAGLQLAHLDDGPEYKRGSEVVSGTKAAAGTFDLSQRSICRPSRRSGATKRLDQRSRSCEPLKVDIRNNVLNTTGNEVPIRGQHKIRYSNE